MLVRNIPMTGSEIGFAKELACLKVQQISLKKQS